MKSPRRSAEPWPLRLRFLSPAIFPGYCHDKIALMTEIYKPGEKVPFSGTYICARGTLLPPVRVQLTKGDPFPEAEGLDIHARWHETNVQG